MRDTVRAIMPSHQERRAPLPKEYQFPTVQSCEGGLHALTFNADGTCTDCPCGWFTRESVRLDVQADFSGRLVADVR